MMPAPCLPASEIASVAGHFRAALAGTPLPVAEMAERLLARSMPPNWALEWSLPRWLGDAMGLPVTISQELALANVFGLGYIRLQDDLADGALAEAERPVALLLATVLFRRWTAVYDALLGADPGFWTPFDDYLGQWVDATWRSQQPPTKAFAHFVREDLLALAHRGAPLKAGAAAVSMLAGRADLLQPLERALDDLLVAAVLLDHAQDWDEDIAAGCYNVFAAYAASAIAAPSAPPAARRVVMQEMLVGRGGRPYFATVQQHLAAAGAAFEAIGCRPLAEYVLWLRGAAGVFRSSWTRRARRQLRAAAASLFEPNRGF